ncbi:MAG: PD-(D/E)XK nuclease family protein [Patescibacteria group bacterium]
MVKHLFQSKPLSWSSIASFEYSPEQWARKYVDGIIDPSNASMSFGNEIGQRLAREPDFLPDVKRYSVFEQCLTGKIDDIQLIGFLDTFDPITKNFNEFKTSSNKKKWTKKSAQAHRQLLMYMFLIWRNYGVPPEKLSPSLFYIPVEEHSDFTMKVSEAKVQEFVVKHTTLELLQFANHVKEVYKEMILFANEYKK